MHLSIIFILYQTVQIILLPVIIAYLIIRVIIKKASLNKIKQGFGFIPKVNNLSPEPRITNKKHNVIWIHAVSVGEILSIQNLIDQIKNKSFKEKNNNICYVTTGTKTGKSIAKKLLNADYISFLPYDFFFSMLLAFKRIKPTSIIIVEAETWPNLLMLAKLLKIPTYSLNARISSRSKKRYQKLKFFFKPLFNSFKIIFTQSKYDKIEFKKLGIIPSKLTILGNIKTLNVLVKKSKLKEETKSILQKTILVGSMHPGELDIYLKLYKKLKRNHPQLKLIIAPRHFHWKNKLVEKIQSLNYSFHLWEAGQLNTKEITNLLVENDILLVCKLGELFKLYDFCNIFFLGGTFVPIGGHNLLEPAVWKKPSIVGPYYQNCKDIADKLENINGLIKVENQKKLLLQTQKLLKDQSLIDLMGNNSQDWLTSEASLVQNQLNILIREL